MNKKYVFELKRKFIHLISLVLVFFYFYFLESYGQLISISPILFFLFIFLILEGLRIKGTKIPIYNSFFRPREKKKLGTHIYFLIGVIIVLYSFDLDIAVAAILMLALGDTVAALVGLRFGKHQDSTKEGTMAELITDLIIGLILLPSFIAIPMAFMATFSEAFFKKIEDNFIVPVLSALTGQILRIIIKM